MSVLSTKRRLLFQELSRVGLALCLVLLVADESLAQIAGVIGGDGERYREACNRLLALIEGPFGALVTTAAGVGAIIASSVGGFKAAWTLIVVAVGAFILRSYISLFFAACS